MLCASGCAPGYHGTDCRDALVFDSDRAGHASVYRILPTDHRARVLTPPTAPGDYSRVPDWSPDKRHVVFQGRRGEVEGLFLIPCEGGAATPLPSTTGAGAPAWSPDGQQIAFVRDARIFVLNMHKGSIEPAAGIPDSSFYPSWSPHGSKLAFVAQGALTWEIFAADMVRGTTRQLTHAGDAEMPSQGPAWSPDGKRIAFDRKRGDDFDIYLMNADGTELARLTQGGAIYARPAWSANGRFIAFHATRDRPRNVPSSDRRYFEIYTMRVDGTQMQRLTTNENFDGHPDW